MAAQREAAEAEHFFDDAEDRFDGLLTQLAASSSTWAKARESRAAFLRRKTQSVSWSGCVSAQSRRTAPFS
jgi:hypothetical protein